MEGTRFSLRFSDEFAPSRRLSLQPSGSFLVEDFLCQKQRLTGRISVVQGFLVDSEGCDFPGKDGGEMIDLFRHRLTFRGVPAVLEEIAGGFFRDVVDIIQSHLRLVFEK